MLIAPDGTAEPSFLPAPFGSSVVAAGMLINTQCHHPAPPVGASGSCTRSAKPFVSLDAPDHLSAGETFFPLQPNPLKTCSSAIVPPGLMSGLVNLNCAWAAQIVENVATSARARKKTALRIITTSLFREEIHVAHRERHPVARSSSNARSRV